MLLQHITNLKNVDERDIVMEIIKLTKINFKETLISIFNHILAKYFFGRLMTHYNYRNTTERSKAHETIQLTIDYNTSRLPYDPCQINI